MLDKHIVLILTGPSGAGKSTVSRLLAERLGSCADIDIEAINYSIVDGFHSQEQDGQETFAFTEWALSGETIGLIAANFLKREYSVIIQGHVNEELIHAIEKHVPVSQKLLLLPSLQSILTRDAERQEGLVMGEAMVKEHYKHFKTNLVEGFVEIDSTADKPNETVEKIAALI